MSRLEMFLENLSLREKFLMSLLIIICAFALAYKSYEDFFQNFFQENMLFSKGVLLEKKEEFAKTQKQKEEIDQQLKKQKQQLEKYQHSLSVFAKDYESYIKEIKEIADAQKVIIKDIQTSFEDKTYFKLYKIRLNLNGNFIPLFEMIKTLEKQIPPYLFAVVEFENITSLHLNANFELLCLSLY
ncbi:hypothetical protein OQH60_04515 [Campylobacter sp. MIT 21-1685]|uniref:hypothetical protein n=1 Tax=unclassified Campylobacter TaxID=2593542 RepID=UPI00224A4ECB|nr:MULTISPECIES: hypothetical protein [unclassified Campylobacter]MCX2683133.1 hypothetical protein [Campylobacter sp. MIT 21-1684]MCX2751407.1 hypothetical protein [Campylobacter sp. MIT 21-1682]MCX2807607.1 hypothetical protein [Campylobacter sp. MIT 21-1685]